MRHGLRGSSTAAASSTAASPQATSTPDDTTPATSVTERPRGPDRTGGPSESFQPGGAFGPMDDFLFHIHRGMLEFVGFQVLDPVVTYGLARMADQERVAALEAVRESVARIAADTRINIG
ncbi:NAD(P)H-dependent oxidoreductase [Streptomyces stramineus]